jgi:hypothetical protein
MTGRKTIEPRPIGDALALTRGVSPWYVVAAVAGIALLVVVARFLEPPSVVADITVDNSTRYDLAIEVSSGDSAGSMAVGSARRIASTTFQEVVDQGDAWTFHFSAQGTDGGEVRISKADLAKAGWKLTIPATVSDELQAKGAEFPP